MADALKPLTPLEKKIYKIVRDHNNLLTLKDFQKHDTLKPHSRQVLHNAIERLELKGYIVPPTPFGITVKSLEQAPRVLPPIPINRTLIDKICSIALENNLSRREVEELRQDLAKRAP